MTRENLLESVVSDHEAELAKVAQRCIMAALDHSRAPKIVLMEEGGTPETAPRIELPPMALRAIADLLGLMGQQQPIMLMPQKHELTTQEAAAFQGRPIKNFVSKSTVNCHSPSLLFCASP